MTAPKQNELRALAEAFAPGVVCSDARPFGSGHINDTYIFSALDCGREERYVLQRINKTVFPSPREVMENIVRVTGYLRQRITEAGGDPQRETINLMPAKGGEYYAVDGAGDYWRAYRFLSGMISYDKCDSERIFYEAARAFGHFQRLLDGFDAQTLYETIANFHNTPVRFDAFELAVHEDRAGRAESVRHIINAALGYKPICSALVDAERAGRLPLRVTHNDTKLNNVLIDERTGRGMCVIDLDTVMPGLSAYDFGDAIRFGASTVAEDEPDADSARLSLGYYRAYARGYLSEMGAGLTGDELASLPLGAKLMTLECAIRFLGDYLNGDVYFKTDYPAHNLTRARTQLALLADMEAHWAQMVDIIGEIREESNNE